MTTKTQQPKVIETFRGYLREHGSGAAAVGWGSAESQQKRFVVLNAIGDLNGATVLDVGCGLGDFWAWLKARSVAAKYIGIDITPEMVTAAKAAHPDAKFILGSVEDYASGKDGESVDFAFASGIFYLDPEAGYDGMGNTLSKIFAIVRKGIAFNSLSSLAMDQEDTEFYADPYITLKLCQSITPWITLRHDYHSQDFTCYLYKEMN